MPNKLKQAKYYWFWHFQMNNLENHNGTREQGTNYTIAYKLKQQTTIVL